jgi:hypothetical protein
VEGLRCLEVVGILLELSHRVQSLRNDVRNADRGLEKVNEVDWGGEKKMEI